MKQVAVRSIAALCVLSFAFPTATTAVAEQKASRTRKQQPSAYSPKDLEDCFRELDKLLSPKDREEFRGKSEGDLIEYHIGLGTAVRNEWGLWAESRLQKYFAGLGVSHPESITMIIFTSYRRHLNGLPINLDEQIARHRAALEKQKKETAEEEKRVVEAKTKVRELMLGFEYVPGNPPTVVMPRRTDDELRARFLARYRGGVFLTVRKAIPGKGLDDTHKLLPYFFDEKSERIHPVLIPEIKDVSFAVVAGDSCWIVGRASGGVILLTLNDSSRNQIVLPRDDEIPQLGLSEDQPLLIYSNAIFQRDGERWLQIYEGDLKLPLSGPPPRKFGDKIYFRDEGRGENGKQLWYLELGAVPRLLRVWEETGVVGPSGPRWENSFSYCVLADRTLWVTFGEGSDAKSLVRRTPDGRYGIAVFNNDVEVRGNLLGEPEDPSAPSAVTASGGWKQVASSEPSADSAGISMSAIAAQSEDQLIGVGDAGLYRIGERRIQRLLRFKDTHQKIPTKERRLYHWSWDPSDILFLNNESYLIGGTFGGVYLLRRQKDSQWAFKALDQKLGAPITW